MLKRVRILTAKQIDQEVRKFNNKVGKLVDNKMKKQIK